jgi:hypothetical protein
MPLLVSNTLTVPLFPTLLQIGEKAFSVLLTTIVQRDRSNKLHLIKILPLGAVSSRGQKHLRFCLISYRNNNRKELGNLGVELGSRSGQADKGHKGLLGHSMHLLTDLYHNLSL